MTERVHGSAAPAAPADRTGGERRKNLRPCRATAVFSGIVVGALTLAVRTYQALLRPHLIGSCKFCPSCSDYAIEALSLHGPFRGLVLSVRRLLRCHPFGPGGLDPVPPYGRAPFPPGPGGG